MLPITVRISSFATQHRGEHSSGQEAVTRYDAWPRRGRPSEGGPRRRTPPPPGPCSPLRWGSFRNNGRGGRPLRHRPRRRDGQARSPPASLPPVHRCVRPVGQWQVLPAARWPHPAPAQPGGDRSAAGRRTRPGSTKHATACVFIDSSPKPHGRGTASTVIRARCIAAPDSPRPRRSFASRTSRAISRRWSVTFSPAAPQPAVTKKKQPAAPPGACASSLWPCRSCSCSPLPRD